MEKYGLEYLLKYFESCGVKIDTITTAQHLQIRSFLKKEYPHICHQFDIWHRSKNMKKKLVKISKKKEEICNHGLNPSSTISGGAAPHAMKMSMF